ncbi:hypothetical protein D3C87_1100860 [compost metagenome]
MAPRRGRNAKRSEGRGEKGEGKAEAIGREREVDAEKRPELVAIAQLEAGFGGHPEGGEGQNHEGEDRGADGGDPGCPEPGLPHGPDEQGREQRKRYGDGEQVKVGKDVL